MPDNILFSSDPAVDLQRFLNQKNYSGLAVLTDENTHRHCYPLVKGALPQHQVITVKSGEEHKNLETCIKIWQAMTDQALDRHAVLLVIGGGVLGDMGGFCAATYKRGIDFILVSTTLLAQVDASIGGKLGVDFNHFKNHIGVFQLPALTLLYDGFLKTLPQGELRSGYAEIIKHILISDAPLWNEIKNQPFGKQDWQKLIRHSVNFKAKVVEEDPREKGLRKILNTGHTIGHAIETYLLNVGRKVLHGEAIAAGLIAEAFIAQQRELLSKDALSEIGHYIMQVFGKLAIAKTDEDAIAQLSLQDKKNKANKILCVLLENIGKARWDCEISQDEVKMALSFYQSF
jgi:3-dehydroquinate synthase